MPTVEHGFNLEAIRAELDASDWEDGINPGSQSRRVYLGTVFTLTPSGKFYTPFTNSNVERCPVCKGERSLPPHPKARTAKRWRVRGERVRYTFERRLKVNEIKARAWLSRHSAWKRVHGPTCLHCGGVGSREAYLDELWREAAEKALDSIGCGLENGEGDPCDMFAVESRDKPEDDPDDVCDECGEQYPDGARTVEGSWHADSCSLYDANIVT